MTSKKKYLNDKKIVAHWNYGLSLASYTNKGSVAGGMYKQALVIEPNSRERRWLETILARAGWRVTQVSNLAELTAEAGTPVWDLVFYTVTGLSESQAATQLSNLRRRLGARPHIIAVGPVGRSAGVVEVLLSGASDYLAKPLRAEAITVRLQEVGPQAAVTECFDASQIIWVWLF